MVEQHKKALEKQLWNIANTLRGNMSADEFRDYILGFIFYKYLSERMDLYADDLLKEDGIKFDAIDENTDEGKEYLEAIKEETIDHLGYFLKPNELFHVLAQKGENGEFILEDLSEVLNHIEQSTMGTAAEDDFNGLFDDLDLTSNKLGKTENAKNELISKVLTHLDDIDFLHHETDIDVLGDAYEYLIGQFASGAGKKAGEFYTPPMVSTLLAKLVTQGKDKLKSVYDPTCGSGSLLLKVSKEIKRKGGEVGGYFGQESNPSTYNLARMNMILHGVHYRNFDIQQDDTLEQPHHVEKRFEAVVANPPFSADWSASAGFLTDERFQDYGKLAPKGKADFAFVQHMIHQLDENGTMAVVLPHGILFRGAAEGHIRKHLIKDKNCIDAVIGLPANVFYGTPIPTCILLLKKNRTRDDIFFIDASRYYTRGMSQNHIEKEDINRVLDALLKREFIDKFSYVAKKEEVANKNEFNLNIPRYVDTFIEEEMVDLKNVTDLAIKLDEKEKSIDKRLKEFSLELGVRFPFGGSNGK
ncbi:type I restriction-modification system subunit M [Colwellia psychrerythraea]|uniref:site-specific DNA-methyltransferase (adenine-specific) n=1 Tax=Colwellia psychrerythraea TaxID=28229 RepID=A0A099K9P2_COLPS|nr:type I restriction-modification system subunit M [Colwellia psychrerythraea]KGJ86990.1 type I restriction-modification system, M subunit [Colwellia psychrerythraea]